MKKQSSIVQAKTYVTDLVSDLKIILSNFNILEKEIKDEKHIGELIDELKEANLAIGSIISKKSNKENENEDEIVEQSYISNSNFKVKIKDKN